MSEIDQFWHFPEAEERIRLDRDLVLGNGLEHRFGFRSATNERGFYSHVTKDELSKRNGDFCRM